MLSIRLNHFLDISLNYFVKFLQLRLLSDVVSCLRKEFAQDLDHQRSHVLRCKARFNQLLTDVSSCGLEHADEFIYFEYWFQVDRELITRIDQLGKDILESQQLACSRLLVFRADCSVSNLLAKSDEHALLAGDEGWDHLRLNIDDELFLKLQQVR